MNRRRYLRTVGATLSPLVAGCSTDVFTGTATERPTRTSTATEAPTPTETEQYADSPGDVEIPRYIELLPEKHLGGTERTDNANFFRVDWEWYLEMRDEPMQFGAASESDWTLEPTEENFATAPEYNILKGPVNATLALSYLVKEIIGGFPNAGPEIIAQCGLESTNAAMGSHTTVEEIVSYAEPGVMYFVGVDIESFREAVKGNESHDYEQAEVTAYSGMGNYSERAMYLSEEFRYNVLAVESGDEEADKLRPTLRRLGGDNENIIVNDSVKWCLSNMRDFPVVTGEINGGKQKLVGNGYSRRGVYRLSEYDSLIQGFDTDGSTANAQLITSLLDGQPPTENELMEIFHEKEGNFTTDHNPNVSNIFGSWN
jgi:hypothetical protein